MFHNISLDEDWSDIVRLTKSEAARVEKSLAEAEKLELIDGYQFYDAEVFTFVDLREWLPVCPDCGEEPHTCAGCGEPYCECTEAKWAEGTDGVTYCSAECAEGS
jgi:hypothetical protein